METTRAQLIDYLVEQTSEFSVGKLLNTPELKAIYLNDLLEDKNIHVFAYGLGELGKGYGMTKLSREIGKARQTLYVTLSGKANPSFETVLRVIDVLGLALKIEPKK